MPAIIVLIRNVGDRIFSEFSEMSIDYKLFQRFSKDTKVFNFLSFLKSFQETAHKYEVISEEIRGLKRDAERCKMEIASLGISKLRNEIEILKDINVNINNKEINQIIDSKKEKVSHQEKRSQELWDCFKKLESRIEKLEREKQDIIH